MVFNVLLCILCWKQGLCFHCVALYFVLKTGSMILLCLSSNNISLFDAPKKKNLYFSITLSLENQKPTKIDWNQNTLKPIYFQPFRSVSVENFTNQNIQFRLTIPIKIDRNWTEHTPRRGHSRTLLVNSESILLIIPSEFLDDFPSKALFISSISFLKLVIVLIGLFYSPGIWLFWTPRTFFFMTILWAMNFFIIVVLVTLARWHIAVLLRDALAQLQFLFD